MSITPTPEQEKALDQIQSWIKTDNPFFVLKGAAGCGKTSVMRILLDRLAETEMFPMLLAPTGKAAVRLNQLTDRSTQTLHRAIYKPWQDSNGRLHFRFRPVHLGKLAIVDESSMLTQEQVQDLCQCFDQVLCIGDDFQLPPVKNHDWFGSIDADARLTTVHRQALESPILRAATKIRLGEMPGPKDAVKGEFDVISQKSINWAKVTDDSLVDQVICATNATRSQLIRSVRPTSSQLPVPGERVIGLANVDHEGPDGPVYFANGSQATVEGITPTLITLTTDDEQRLQGRFYPQYFQSHYRKVDIPPYDSEEKEILRLDFAHCITGHKSQGSQWDRVLVYDDANFLKSKSLIEYRRWLYTCLTRAVKRLVWAI